MSGAVPELRFTREDGSDFPDWEERELGNICKLKSGDFVPSSGIENEQQDDLFRCYGGNGLRGYVTSYNKDGTFPLIGRQGALCGNVHLVSGKFHATEHAVIAEPKEGIIVQWLFYKLKQMNLNQYATGVAQPGLAVGSLINLLIDVPHHEEQKKIAAALSDTDAKLTALREKADGLRQFKTGLMQRLFSQELRFTRDDGSDYPDWEEKPFSEIATRAGEQFDPRKENGKPRVIELEHLESGSGKILSSADIDGQISLKNRFRSGDVLFGKLRPYLRKFARPEFDGVCSSEIWVLRGRKGISNSFLYALVQSPMFSQVVNISSGSKMPRADWKTIAGVDFPVPCPEEQEKIASALSALDAKIDAVTDQITHMETFKKGLLQKMFV